MKPPEIPAKLTGLCKPGSGSIEHVVRLVNAMTKEVKLRTVRLPDGNYQLDGDGLPTLCAEPGELAAIQAVLVRRWLLEGYAIYAVLRREGKVAMVIDHSTNPPTEHRVRTKEEARARMLDAWASAVRLF